MTDREKMWRQITEVKPSFELHCGDCLELLKNIPAGSVDMILCDLPYGISRNKWDTIIPFDALWNAYERVIKENGAIVLFGSGRFTAELIVSNSKLWRYNLVWEKTTPTGFLNAKKMPLRCHEDVLVFYKALPTYNPCMTQGERKVSTAKHKRNSKHGDSYGDYDAVSYDSDKRYPRSVLHFSTDKQKSALHPTQKPVALLEYLVKTYTNPGEMVLDSCMGSGSTGVACVNTERRFIGIEIDKQYFGIAKERIEDAARWHPLSETPKEE